MTTFLVNTLLEDLSMGEANTLTTVMDNLQLIGVDYKKEILQELEVHKNDPLIQFAICGRYINIIVLWKDKEKAQMTFVDTLNDYDRALEIGQVLKIAVGHGFIVDEFMQVFERHKSTYDLDKDACILDIKENFGSVLN